jgi:glycosyltransferase involved in cell wall biosynthesis
MKLFFTIITINFNNINGLTRTFTSVVEQSFKDYEYIVIDGGSTDGSKEFLLDNSNKIDYWVSECDEGIYHAMNKGIDKAKGKYCIFLNSGDYFFDREVLQLCSMEINSIDKLNNNNLIFVGSTQNENSKKIFSPPEHFSLFHFYYNSIPHQGEFIPVNLLKNSKFTLDYISVSDWIKNIQFLLLGIPFLKLKTIEIIAITEDEGISSTEVNSRERELFLNKNSNVFSNFENIIDFEGKQSLVHYEYLNKVINKNLMNKLLWQIMRMGLKS